jgi:putative flippase GtrA
MNWLRSHLAELPAYFVVSCIGLTVDTGVLLLLTSMFHWPYLFAATTSFVAGGAVGYILCVRFVWRTDSAASKTYEVTLFILTGLAGLAINSAVMFAVVSGLGAAVLIGKGTAAGCTFLCNFYLRRRLVFAGATRRIIWWRPEEAGK